MMRNPLRLSLGAWVLFITFVACGPANGQLVNTTYGPFSVNCTPVGQLCDNTFSQSVTTDSTLRVEYVASPAHCSPVLAHILIDGIEVAATAFLAPGASSGVFDVGPVSSGTHVVALRGEGILGGCNIGVLGNWGGTMTVTTAQVSAAATAIPAMTAPMLWVLAASVLLAAGLVMSRR